MPLIVELGITAGGGVQEIETLRISRLTSLHHRAEAAGHEVHQYLAERFSPAGESRRRAQFTHRYGDGAWKCTLLALQALEAS
jgi:hypothetical protein